MKAITTTLTVLLLTVLINAQPPQAFKYQVVIREASGDILANQAVGIRISIHDATAGGTIVYQETFSETTNDHGLVNMQIGNGTATIGSFVLIDWGSTPKFFETEIDPAGGTSYVSMGTSELLSVPYAMFSQRSSLVSDDGVTNIYVGQNAGQMNTSGTYNSFVGYQSGGDNTSGSFNSFFGSYAGGSNTNGDWNTCIGVNSGYNNLTGDQNIFIGSSAGYYETGSNKLYINNDASSYPLIYGEFDTKRLIFNGNVGIEKQDPQTLLHINTDTPFDPGNYADRRKGTLILGMGAAGTQGQGNYGPSLSFSGISTGRRRAAIASIQTSPDSDQVGLAFFTHPTTSTSNNNVTQQMVIDHYGNVGIGVSTPVSRLEVTNDNATAIHGSSTNNTGIWASSVNSYGMFAQSSYSYAAYFSGPVHISGSLSKGSGSFLIDHPLDPENKLLRHNFVESPENLLIYRGKAELDSDGEAFVRMPGYFIALTKEDEASIHLTPVGRPFLTGAEWNKDFTAIVIFGDNEREVFWEVLAERDDPVIHELGRPVEEEKGGENALCEKGMLLYPKAYGFPESKGRDYKYLDQQNPESGNWK